MAQTFFQKFVLTIVASFAFSLVIWVFRNVVEAGNDAVNGRWQKNSAPRVVK